MGRIVLLRPAHPDSHDGRCIGHHDTELSRYGRDSVADLVASYCAGRRDTPRRVITSDLARARATAEPLAKAWDRDVEIDARFRELDFGAWEARRWDEINTREPQAMRDWGADWVNIAPPGGESGVELAQRISSALEPLVAQARCVPGDIVVATHGGVIRVAATLLLREPLSSAFVRSIDYLRAAIFAVDETGARLTVWNADISSV